MKSDGYSYPTLCVVLLLNSTLAILHVVIVLLLTEWGGWGRGGVFTLEGVISGLVCPVERMLLVTLVYKVISLYGC